jgi:hypothetical protein
MQEAGHECTTWWLGQHKEYRSSQVVYVVEANVVNVALEVVHPI